MVEESELACRDSVITSDGVEVFLDFSYSPTFVFKSRQSISILYVLKIGSKDKIFPLPYCVVTCSPTKKRLRRVKKVRQRIE